MLHNCDSQMRSVLFWPHKRNILYLYIRRWTTGAAIVQWRHLPGKIVLDVMWRHMWKTCSRRPSQTMWLHAIILPLEGGSVGLITQLSVVTNFNFVLLSTSWVVQYYYCNAYASQLTRWLWTLYLPFKRAINVDFLKKYLLSMNRLLSLV